MLELDKVKLAIETLKSGGIVIVTDDEDRENEGDIIFAAEFSTSEKINFCLEYGSGVICASMDQTNADRLGLAPMEKENTDPFYTAFYSSLDADPKYGISTGISAIERSKTINMLANQSFTRNDFRRPGHVFPLVAKPYGVLQRPGHTEASIDLMELAGLQKCAVICELRSKNGEMMRGDELINFASDNKIPLISVQLLKKHLLLNKMILSRSPTANLPTEFGMFQIKVYKNPITMVEHAVLMAKHEEKDNQAKPFVRIHSECITGEVFASKKCDCRDQLHAAMSILAERKNGAIIYLRGHEGRGIGLENKIKAYALQDQGRNTIDANKDIGLPVDARDYSDAIMILRHLKLDNFDLYSGNPAKIAFMRDFGFTVSQVVPTVKACEFNVQYLQDKRSKLNHNLNILQTDED